MTIQDYLNKVNQHYQTGIATEHTYRGHLQNLLESLTKDILITNESTRIACGAPDYVLTKNDIPLGYIEAKDINDPDLVGKKANKKQFNRYKESLDNIIFTDYLDFLLYINGELVTSVRIAEIQEGQIIPLTENFDKFRNIIQDFTLHIGQTIKSASKLAKMMAGKAKLLGDVIEQALNSDEESHEDSTLKAQMDAFKQILIHDIKPKGFADIYAQTIAYGMFAARLHDPTLNTFSRQEAAELIPKSNPFLRKLFQYIAGYDLDFRIVWIVDALADIFRATDVAAILQNFGQSTQMNDPIIHFYETFLAEYDPQLRKAKGVWYTPEPVVDFIVRAVDDILKTEFDLPKGLADTSKTKIKIQTQTVDNRTKSGYKEVEKEVHKVQILDPATGTGTFLAHVVKYIYNTNFKAMQGMWSSYVENHLIPRLNGFELLMASYAMAHLKLDLLLTETGYKKKKDQRFKVYLTNSLEESHPDTGTLFANWLSSEANEANNIKRNTPVMCVIGNPPYSLSSSNKSEWIETLVSDYKNNLKEQNINALSDDYVKFIRYGQFFIDKNRKGLIAMITNNSFIDGITQREMRASLLKTFDKIYIYDLHGSEKRKEKAKDGSKDENVFDIQQGVSISFFIKKGNTKQQKKEVLHFDSLGKRAKKYKDLSNQSINSINWTKIIPSSPYFFFVPKDNTGQDTYKEGFSIKELFSINGNGIKFRKDNLLVKYHFKPSDVIEMLDSMNDLSEEDIYNKYNFNPTKDWEIKAKRSLFIKNDNTNIVKINYRQFDNRFSYYPLKSIAEIIVRGDSRKNLMKNYIHKENIGLIIGRQGQVVGNMQWNLVFITESPSDMNIFYRGGGINFPLYLYPEDNNQLTTTATTRTPNLDTKLVAQIAKSIGLEFTNEKENRPNTFAPIDILDYIYGILHSPTYREKYKEFLKIDFPRVPYPKDQTTFWKLVELGGELRQYHLLEHPQTEQYITGYPQDGDNIVTRKMTKKSIGYEPINEQLGKVWINEEQYFENVPLVAWEFYIGGYQPAQKWLKDRKDRELSFEDILHYQKIIKALVETDRIMKEIDKLDF